MNVMLVDDDRECLDSLGSALRLEGFRVSEFAAPARALDKYSPQAFDVIITDYYLPGMTGVKLLEEIHRRKADTPVIIISGAARTNMIKRKSLKAGARAFFSKPLDIRQLIDRLKQVA